jgi:uncharacterized membrane protein
MNKQEYIATLHRYLSSLPEDERNELLRDYEAHFVYGLQSGKSETDIIRELGDPLTLAREAIGTDFIPPPPWAPPRKDLPRLVSVSILLIFMNLMIVIPVGVSIWAAFISICAVVATCILAPVALVVETALYNDFMPGKLFVAIGMTGIGMLFALLVRFLGKHLASYTVRYGKWNYKTWRGRS